MKILIVADGFLPGKKYGGPTVSVNNFCSLMEDFACYVVARDHDMGERTPYGGIRDGWNDRGNCKVRYLPDEQYNAATFEAIILELRPDWVYLQSLFQSCVISCLWLARKHHIKVMLAPRGELCKGAFRKKYKKIPYIAVLHMLGLLKDVCFQSTSEEETGAIGRFLGADRERIYPLSNVPSLPNADFPPRSKKPGVAKLVFLSRIHPKKNLLAAIGYLDGVAGDVTLDVYGPLEDEAYWRSCEAAAKRLSANVQVRYCGLVEHEQVHQVFSRYDALLFPTLSENYGHVIVEAMLTGCPAILSDQTPWLDLQEHGAGWAIPLKEEGAFREAISQVIGWDEVPEQQVRAYIRGKLDLERLRGDYRAAFGA